MGAKVIAECRSFAGLSKALSDAGAARLKHKEAEAAAPKPTLVVNNDALKPKAIPPAVASSEAAKKQEKPTRSAESWQNSFHKSVTILYWTEDAPQEERERALNIVLDAVRSELLPRSYRTCAKRIFTDAWKKRDVPESLILKMRQTLGWDFNRPKPKA